MELTVVFESDVGVSTIAWEQGMWLLLSASDLEMPVQAVFLRPVGELSALPETLGKKLQQFDLYDIPSFALESSLKAEKGLKESQIPYETGEKVVDRERNQLDWSWVQSLAGSKLAERMEQSQQIITV